MTMQGIALITPGTGKMAQDKATKASAATFDSFMNNQAAKVSGPTETKAVNPAVKSEKGGNQKELAANQFDKENSVKLNTGASGDKVKDTSTYQTPEEQILDAEKVAGIVAQTMILLQELFGLTSVELQDIMNQLSVQPQDLLLQVQGTEVTLVNTGAIQEMLLGIHGMEDAAAFITNDRLNQELTEVTEQITDLLAEGFDVPVEELADLEPAVLADFAGQVKQLTQTLDAGDQPVDNRSEDSLTADTKGEALTVVYEQVKTETDTEDGESQEDALTDGQSQSQAIRDDAAPQATAAGAFTENLVRAFGEVRDTEQIAAETTMRQIVEQVVHQVKIRVMPETTSMELQLHPASLGRVALTVTTTAVGAATASLVVENQMAKQALESQMIQLKESFAEQGLKVDAVEVTVAEFGLKKENQQQDDPSGNRKQNRRFRSDDALSEEEDTTTEQVTGSERRDINSTVDYTA